MMKIGQFVKILLLSSFIGIVFNPELMVAADEVNVTGVALSGVETILPEPVTSGTGGEVAVEEPVQEEVYEEPAVSEEAPGARYAEPEPTEVQAVEEPAPEEPTYVAPANRIEITGNTVELEYTNTTESNAGDAIKGWYYKTGKFLFAHNYKNVFGKLDAAYDEGRAEGMRFTVVWDGVTSVYTVKKAVVYSYDDTAARMWDIIYAREGGTQYKMAVMTCYGANSRLVLYAD